MFKKVEFALETLGAMAIIALCLLIVANVVFRELLGFAVPDGIILVRELMVVAILFPLSAATSKRAHVSIEVIANLFPAWINRWIAVLAGVVALIIVATLLAAGWVQFSKDFASGAHNGGDLFVPKWISRGTFTLAFAFVFLRLLHNLWEDFQTAVRGEAAPTML